jgi:hypothetical protein
MSLPIYGTADTKFVITVAAHKDICPHGNTYPTNAVKIMIKYIITPLPHTAPLGNVYDP